MLITGFTCPAISSRAISWIAGTALLLSLFPALQAAEYVVDQKQSLLVINVYRAGALKGLGHNHIISSSDINGRISYISGKEEDATFYLSLPVSSFEVDNHNLRKQAGKQFSAFVDDSAKKGTYKNMLGLKVLDALSYPKIRVSSKSVRRINPYTFNVDISITVRNSTKIISVPVTIKHTRKGLIAQASFSVNQSEFGIKPLTAALGTIKVADNLDIKIDLAAMAI